MKLATEETVEVVAVETKPADEEVSTACHCQSMLDSFTRLLTLTLYSTHDSRGRGRINKINQASPN